MAPLATLRLVATIEQPQTEHDEKLAGLTLTERAAGKVRAMMEQEPAGSAEVLRVAIRGGGCGGFEYALGFDRGAAEGDSAYAQHGVTVVVDPASAPYLKGATVDFVESLQESGFKIENPNASSSCGCGHSFQVEDGETAKPAAATTDAARFPATCASDSAMSFRVAVVGSGPAGFYTADALLKSDVEVEVDLIERLPTPWGLVRLGVAPDHPELKAASKAFERTARLEGFRFFGNVEVGMPT